MHRGEVIVDGGDANVGVDDETVKAIVRGGGKLEETAFGVVGEAGEVVAESVLVADKTVEVGNGGVETRCGE